MSVRGFLATLLSLALIVAGVPVLAGQGGSRGVVKLEAHLIWGTNDDKSPNPNHKPVDEEIKRKLKELPLKWSNYFEVNRQSFQVAPGEPKKVPMSTKCDIEVRLQGQSMVEVSLFGKGTHVFKQTQALPKGEMLILGGQAPNSTSWLVALKRIE